MHTKRVGVVCFAMCLLLAPHATAADRDSRLIEASKRADAPMVRALLAADVDVNARAADDATALHWAADQDALEVADLLIRKGAAVDAKTRLGVTPLWIAARNSNTAMITRLLQAHADPNIAPPTDGAPLMIAAQRGNAAAVKALLAAGADPNAREARHGQTALMWAAAEGHPDVVRLLIAAGADVRARSKSWMQRVNLCCQLYQGDETGVTMIERGGFTPLLFAAQDGDVESARLILAAGADVNETAPEGLSALVVAAHVGQTGMAAFLLDSGADPNSAGAGYTALHVAATRGDLALVKALLAHRADPNARQLKGSPSKRLRSGHALDHLLVGATPFALAAVAGRLEVMRTLVAGGADPSLTLADGRTTLMLLAGYATQWGPLLSEARGVEALKLAIQLGTPVNRADRVGDTALHIAAAKRRDLFVQALVDSGAALNARNRNGQTPLDEALAPPPKLAGLSQDSEYMVAHTGTPELLRKLGAKT